MTSRWAVPTIDISPYVGPGAPGHSATAAAIDAACRDYGFMQVVGHGIPSNTTAALAEAMDRFFELPAPSKAGYRAPPQVNRGYSPPNSEKLSLSLGLAPAPTAYDFFEAFNVGRAASWEAGGGLPIEHYPENLWPAEVPDFRPAVEEYFVAAAVVARSLLRAFADALQLPSGFFAPFATHSIDVMRMNNYVPPSSLGPLAEARGMGEHTDYGMVTVLWADQEPGLQVLGRNDNWHDVTPADGALLVNLGDLMARWTNEHWLSTMHRVVPPTRDGVLIRRRSAAFFHDGNYDAVIETLPGCEEGPGPGFGPITVGEHLAAKLAGSRGLRAYQYGQRDAARLGSAGP